MRINKRLIKGINWALVGFLSMLGFVGCEKAGMEEYGTPHADYTVKGVVVDKATGKPIKGIRVGYSCGTCPTLEYGVLPTSYTPKSHVTTNEKGVFKLTDSSFPGEFPILPVHIEDIDGKENGLFQSERLEADFKKAERTKKPERWYEGEYTVTIKVELTEIKDE